MDRIYFDPEDEQRDGKGWNVVESGGAIALRYATKAEAEAYVAAEEAQQFWTMELEPTNVADLLENVSTTLRAGHARREELSLVGLVDEESGGIIAYVIKGNELSLLAHLNGK